MISSQPSFEQAPRLAVAAANAATLGIAAALQRWGVSESDAIRREHLEDMRLPDPLRELLDREMKASIGGSVEHDCVRSEIGAPLQIQYTVARTPAQEIVLLDIPASILSGGNQVRRLLELYYLLCGKIVRVFSHDLRSDPSPALNGLKILWEAEERDEKDRIYLDYVPLSHVEELERGEADLGNVLKLDLRALAVPTESRSSGLGSRAGDQGRLEAMKIFLASSEELRADRDEFDLHFRQRNDEFLKRGIYLKIIRWENFLDAMSETRLQDEYNKAVRECDIFVCLFFTKTGKFTEEEFDTAHDQFKRTGKPRIFTFFKNADVKIGDLTPDALNSLFTFQAKLGDLGHFYSKYNSVDHLKLQFERQLSKLIADSSEPQRERPVNT